jgi:hypothetical protein
MITELDKQLYKYYKEFIGDKKFAIIMKLYNIRTIEDFKQLSFYNTLTNEMKKELRKEKLKKIL